MDKQKINLEEIIAKDAEIHNLSKKLPPEMLEKILQIESCGNQFAISPTGALGCMQLTKYIYHDINPPINPFNPVEAVKRAATHLADLNSKYGENDAVKAYNQGEGNRGNSEANKYLAAYKAAKTRIS